tara:strand:- start:63 stop:227 length:165 start_codon:yes stop_codon:yes gene_type:complete
MIEPTIKDLEKTISYLINPEAYGIDSRIIALATIMYCDYMGTTPQELLKLKLSR